MTRAFSSAFRARFWAKVAVGDGCWLWTAATDSNGYGRIRLDAPQRAMIGAHQVSYLIHHGLIPHGCQVLHRCDVKRCVNPAHLYAGTPKQNSRDSVERGLIAAGERNGQAVLSAETVDAIRREYARGGVTQRALAAKYGVCYPHIHQIVTGKRWASTMHRDNTAQELLENGPAKPGGGYR